MGLLDFLKKAKDWVAQHIVAPVGHAIQGAANFVGQLPGAAVNYAQQHLPGVAQAALPGPIGIGASQLIGAAQGQPTAVGAIGNSQILQRANQVAQMANPLNLPKTAANVFQATQAIPVVKDFTQVPLDLIKSGLAPTQALGHLAVGDLRGARQAVQQSPLLQRSQDIEKKGGNVAQQFVPAVGLGAEAGTYVAPFPALKGGSLAAQVAKGALAGSVAGGGFEAGREAYQGEKLNPANIAAGAVAGGALVGATPVAGKVLGKAAQGVKGLVSPTTKAAERVTGPPATLTSMGQIGDHIANPDELRTAANQIRATGSVQVVPTETITQVKGPALQQGVAKLAGQTPAPPTVQVSKGIRVVPTDKPVPSEVPKGETWYHGSASTQPTFRGSTTGELGPGLYLTKDKNYAKGFTQNSENFRTGKVSELSLGNANLKTITKKQYLADRQKFYNQEQSLNGGKWDSGVASRAESKLNQFYQSQGYDGLHVPEEKQAVIFPESMNKVATPKPVEPQGKGGVSGLSAEARKAGTFENFKHDYLNEIKHGQYYHITDNPNFKIDPNSGPRDMSSMGGGKVRNKGALMVTSDLEHWVSEYPNRKYVAVIDMSSVPRGEFGQVNRGFGNEFFVKNPAKAKTTKVIPVEQALKEDAQYRASLPKSEAELRQLYDQSKATASQAKPVEPPPEMTAYHGGSAKKVDYINQNKEIPLGHNILSEEKGMVWLTRDRGVAQSYGGKVAEVPMAKPNLVDRDHPLTEKEAKILGELNGKRQGYNPVKPGLDFGTALYRVQQNQAALGNDVWLPQALKRLGYDGVSDGPHNFMVPGPFKFGAKAKPVEPGTNTITPNEPPPPSEPVVKVGETPPGPQREFGRSQALRASEDVPQPVKEQLGQTYAQRPSAAATQDAYTRLKQDPNAAQEYANTIKDAVDSLQSMKGGTKAAISRETFNPETSDKIVALTQHYIDKGDDASLTAAANLTRDTQELYSRAGQFNQAAANFDRLGSAGMVRYAEREASAANVELSPEFRKYYAQKADELAKMPEGEDKNFARFLLQNDLGKQLPVGTGEKIINFWKAGLLTNPATTAGNIFSNTGSLIGEKVSDVFATGMDLPLSVVTGQRSKALSFRGGLSGAGEGAGKGWKYLKTGYDERHLANKYDAPKIINNGNNPLGKTLDLYENGVFRMMGGEDFPFYYSRKANSLYDQGIVAMRNGQITRSQLKDFVKDPTSFPGGEEALKNATADASYAVFQNDTAIGLLAQHLANQHPILGNFIAPFRRTPAAVAMRVWDYSPLGAGQTIINAAKAATSKEGLTQTAQRNLVQGLGRAGTGTALIAAGLELYKKGILTLSYPKDPKEQQLWKLEGKQPYSIKVGGKWRSLNYAAPWGQLLAVGGFLKQGYDQTGSMMGAVTSAFFGGGKTLTDQTFLKGVAGLAAAWNYPQQFGEKYAEQVGSSLIPSVVRNIAVGLDPYQRDTQGVTDAIKSAIPGLRETLRPQLNVFGDPIPAPRNLPEQLFDPTRPSNVLTGNAQDVANFRAAGYVPGKIDKNAGKVGGQDTTLTPDQLYQLRVATGKLFRQQLDQATSNPDFQALPPDLKKTVIENASKDANALGKLLLSENLHIGNPDVAFDELSTNQKKLALGIQPDYVGDVTKNKAESDFEDANKPRINRQIEQEFTDYLSFPAKSQARRDYLASHPELQGYFNNKDNYLLAYKAKFGELPFGEKEPFAKSGGTGKRRFASKRSRFAKGSKTVKISRSRIAGGATKSKSLAPTPTMIKIARTSSTPKRIATSKAFGRPKKLAGKVLIR